MAPAEVIDEDFLFEVSRGSFVQRRKTILNNLQSSLPDGKAKKEQILQAFEKNWHGSWQTRRDAEH